MRLTALQPPPPSPSTLIVAECSGTKRFASAMVCGSSGKRLGCMGWGLIPDRREPRPELGERGSAAAAVEMRRCFAARTKEHEADGGRVFRLLDRIGQPRDRRRHADAHR